MLQSISHEAPLRAIFCTAWLRWCRNRLPFCDRSSPTFSAALGQFIKAWAMFGAVPNRQCIQTHVQYQKVANFEGFHTSPCFGNTDTIFVLPYATCYMTLNRNSEITARQWEVHFNREGHQYFFKVTCISVGTVTRLWDKAVFLKLGSAKGCQGYRETKRRNGWRALLAVLNLYVRFKIRVATFDAYHPVTDSRPSVAVHSRNLRTVVKSVSATRHRHSRCFRRNDQVIHEFQVSRWLFTCNVHKRLTNAGVSFYIWLIVDK